MPDRPSVNSQGRLSKRQVEILILIRDGYQNSEISQKLTIRNNTTHNHIKAILRTLGAKNRTHAVVIAIQRGIIPLGE